MKKVIILLAVVFLVAAFFDIKSYMTTSIKIEGQRINVEKFRQVISHQIGDSILLKPIAHTLEGNVFRVTIDEKGCANNHFYSFHLLQKDSTHLPPIQGRLNSYPDAPDVFQISFENLDSGRYIMHLENQFEDAYTFDISISDDKNESNHFFLNSLKRSQLNETHLKGENPLLSNQTQLDTADLKIYYKFGTNDCDILKLQVSKDTSATSMPYLLSVYKKVGKQPFTKQVLPVNQGIIKDLFQLEVTVSSKSSPFSTKGCSRTPPEAFMVKQGSAYKNYIIRDCKFYLRDLIDKLILKHEKEADKKNS